MLQVVPLGGLIPWFLLYVLWFWGLFSGLPSVHVILIMRPIYYALGLGGEVSPHLHLSLHKKWNFRLRISSLNVTKSAGNCGFGHIYWRNPLRKSSFFMQCLYSLWVYYLIFYSLFYLIFCIILIFYLIIWLVEGSLESHQSSLTIFSSTWCYIKGGSSCILSSVVLVLVLRGGAWRIACKGDCTLVLSGWSYTKLKVYKIGSRLVHGLYILAVTVC